MRVLLWSGLVTVSVVGRLPAQVAYDVTFPNARHHEAEISVTFADLPPGPLELRMSRSSPGRYALHEFAKNVYALRAVDEMGNSLAVERPSPYQWDVVHHGGTVRVTYTLFADRADGTYSQVDETHAHFNIPASFMWGRGLGDRPIRISFAPPEGSNWKVASQLFPTDDPMTFTAPDLYYFLDSPTELSDFSLREWTVTGADTSYTMRLAIHHDGTEAEVDAYADMARRVVDQEIAVFGEPPAFDGGSYTFIADYLPHVSGDGMEHRNSTILSSSGSLERGALRMLGTVSHEFFHAWNVERIRPRSLEPFDFERTNMSAELWFAEGFTSYYTPLFIRRAGLTTVDDFARSISGGLNFVINAPGRRFFSPMEMSMQAPFVDAATAVDPNNRSNTFISYYTWGSVIGLNLELTLRSEFGQTLDDYMKAVWERFGRTEIPYTVDDLEQTLAAVTGDSTFATGFFARYIRDGQVPDYKALLAHAGFLLRPARGEGAWLGDAQLQYGGGAARITTNTGIGSPWYEAGIDRGHVIRRLDGQDLQSADALGRILRAHAPGDTLEVEFDGRGPGSGTTTVTLAPNPRLEVVTYEEAGLIVTDAMVAFREGWLGGRNNE